MIDYSQYKFSVFSLIWEIGKAAAFCMFTGWLFFDSLLGSLCMLPAALLIFQKRKKQAARQRVYRLRDEFKEFIVSFSSSLQAGYTVEQAVLAGAEDLKRMLGDKEGVLLRELVWMEQQMKLKVPCESLFADLAKRSGLEEIRSFSVILAVGRRQGGNLVQITKKTALHIGKKIQVQKEIEQAVAGKVMEKNIMKIMPYFMIFYLRITNGEYLQIMFSSFYGNCMMAIGLILLWVANRWADHILEINL